MPETVIEASSASMPHQAMLLTAGRGTRLRPLTENVPKCMVPLLGKPLLEHTIEHLRANGITQIIINLHYLPEVVPDYFGDGSRWDVQLTYAPEAELLGTAGSVKKSARFFDGPFFVWYGDNLSTCRLDRLWQQHQWKAGVATIALHEREDPTQSGIVGLDATQRITRFLEKPNVDQVFSHWVNAGIFVLDPEVLDSISDQYPVDFGRDVFPQLLAEDVRLYGYQMSSAEGLWWVDTVADLERAQASLSAAAHSALIT